MGALVLLGMNGCGDVRGRDRAVTATAVAVAEPEVALTLNDSTSIWYTLQRESRSESDSSCIERGLEIRTGGRRQLVPLLYTAEAPMVIDDSTVQVALYRHCRPDQLYRVNLGSGQPTPVR